MFHQLDRQATALQSCSLSGRVDRTFTRQILGACKYICHVSLFKIPFCACLNAMFTFLCCSVMISFSTYTFNAGV